MRRKDKLVEDRKEIDAIIGNSDVCRLAMAMGDQPYLVPLSFGYDGQAIYLHTADRGKKIDHFKANPKVCFEFESNVKIVAHPTVACKWSVAFETVIGFGTIEEMTTPEEKQYGLKQIMRHYSGKDWDLDGPGMPRTRVWRITLQSLTGKRAVD